MKIKRSLLTLLLAFSFHFQGAATPADDPCKYTIEELIRYAKKFRGIRYKSGGSKPSGFDCSGFVNYIYKKFQIPVERSSAAMFIKGMSVGIQHVLPGDLIFFSRSSKPGSVISHVGIVVKSEEGKLKFIHSSTTHGVIISDLSEEYYSKRFKGLKRMPQLTDFFHFPFYYPSPEEQNP